jgi:hypothetical protein
MLPGLLQNEGTFDRSARLIIGLGILSLAFIGPRSAWGYLGLIPIATAIVGLCPFYTLFGTSTYRATPK